MTGKTIKKLLLEEKAKAYDEALEKAKKELDNPNIPLLWKTWARDLFPELKESEDERTKKEIITFIKSVAYAKTDDVKRYVAWLEKQDNPKKSDPVVAKFQEGDRVIHKTIPGFECIIENIDDTTYYGDTTNFDIVDQDKWEKAMPKFHIQDWITDGYRTERILDIKGPDYILQSQDGDTTCYDPISYVDPRYHSWTIQDVRPGDILIDDFGIYVFKKPDDLDNTAYFCSCAYQYSDKKFEYTSMICNLSGAHLASKDQCEDFFAWMKDAGYEWDPDEKRPVENRKKDDSGSPVSSDSEEPGAPCSVDCGQSWKDSDKEMLEAAISYVEHCTFTTIGKGRLATIAWLKSLENKVWPKQEWDQSDEHNLQGIIDEIKANKSEAPDHDAGTYDRFLEFLESLRDRVGKASYDPYKTVVGSIREMCDKYESRIEDKESARDFLNNVRVKCKDAKEYDRTNRAR